MPTEHEFKFVLTPCEDLHQKVQTVSQRTLKIEQGYLQYSKGATTRVRRLETSGQVSWYFTFKQKVETRVIELEKKLDDRDGVDLWNVCIGKLSKLRYEILDEQLWEVDFFYAANQDLYFALAEVELPEGQVRPRFLPHVLMDHLVHAVDLTDDRFSNKRLGDVNYAKQLLETILEKENDYSEA